MFIDFHFGVKLLDEGGVILFDDATFPDVAKVLAFIRKNMTESLEEIDLEPFRPETARNMRYKLAKVLRRTQLAAFRRRSDPTRPWNSKLISF